MVEHDIVMEHFTRVRLRPYRIPKARHQAVRDEVREMLWLGVNEESQERVVQPHRPRPETKQHLAVL